MSQKPRSETWLLDASTFVKCLIAVVVAIGGQAIFALLGRPFGYRISISVLVLCYFVLPSLSVGNSCYLDTDVKRRNWQQFCIQLAVSSSALVQFLFLRFMGDNAVFQPNARDASMLIAVALGGFAAYRFFLWRTQSQEYPTG